MSPFHSPTVISFALVGRQAQLALLTDLLVQAGSGQGQGVLISGEAGIGKSRLVAEVTDIAGERGTCILRRHCFDHNRALPYAPLIDMLRTFCAGCPPTSLSRRLGQQPLNW